MFLLIKNNLLNTIINVLAKLLKFYVYKESRNYSFNEKKMILKKYKFVFFWFGLVIGSNLAIKREFWIYSGLQERKVFAVGFIYKVFIVIRSLPASFTSRQGFKIAYKILFYKILNTSYLHQYQLNQQSFNNQYHTKL